MAGDNPDGGQTLPLKSNAPVDQSNEFYLRAVKLAHTTIGLLESRLKTLEEEVETDQDGSRSEARTKELLTIAKAIASLEELINRMDASINESSLYPQDALEFHKQIEERIKKFSNL